MSPPRAPRPRGAAPARPSRAAPPPRRAHAPEVAHRAAPLRLGPPPRAGAAGAMAAGVLRLRPRGPRAGRLDGPLGRWAGGGRALPCAIGRAGASGAKREGDGATPMGVLRITGLLWRADRIARPRWPAPLARPIGPSDLWCDDPGHPAYNRRARAPLRASAERLKRADRLYDLVLLTDWNAEPAQPGRGSAIFVHRWRGPGRATEGCVALAPRALRRLMARLRPGARIAVGGWSDREAGESTG